LKACFPGDWVDNLESREVLHPRKLSIEIITKDADLFEATELSKTQIAFILAAAVPRKQNDVE
jgi:hypothetical protein